uniref:CSON009305 protein n=1 Tax=Culicoides sonorensis TaxID=179676 RepID=A0A336M3S1_CULSO
MSLKKKPNSKQNILSNNDTSDYFALIVTSDLKKCEINKDLLRSKSSFFNEIFDFLKDTKDKIVILIDFEYADFQHVIEFLNQGSMDFETIKNFWII